MKQLCPSCDRRLKGDPRFCPCVDDRVLGLAPAARVERPNLVLQSLVIIGFQVALVLLFQPLFGS